MTSKTHQIAMEINAKTKSTFSSSFMDAISKVSALQQKMKEFEIAGAKSTALDSSFVKMKQRTQDMQYQWVAASVKAKQLGEAIKSTESPTKAQSREFEKAQTRAHNLQLKLEKLREQQKDIELSSRKQADSVKNLSAEYAKAGVNVAKFGKIQEQQAKIAALHAKSDAAMQKAFFAKSMVQTTIGLTAKLAHPIQKALEIEAAAAQVQKNIHFESLKEYKEWQDKLFQLGQKNPVAQLDLLHMAEQAGSSAIAKDQISGLVEEAAKLSSVMRISGEDATKLLIGWRTGLNLTQTGANSLADALVNLGDKSANTTSWLASFVAQAGQEGKMAGLAAEQTAAFGSAITDMAPEKAATAFTAVTNAMTKGVRATKSQMEVYHALGINVKKLQDDMKVDAVKSIMNIVNLIKTKIPQAQQSAVSTALVGATGSPLMAQLINNQALIEKQLSIVSKPANYAGRVDKEANIVNSSTIAQIQLLKNNIDSLQLTLAETFLPTVRDIVNVAKEIVNRIKPWIEGHSELLKVVVPLAAGLAGISVAVAGMTWLFSGTLAIAIKTAAAAMWVFNTAISANPISLAIASIAAMSLMLYKFFTQTEAGKYCINKLVDGIIWLMDRVQQHITMRIQQILDVWNKVKEIAGSIQDYFAGDNKAAQVNVVHKIEKNNLDESIKQLQQSNAARSKPAAVNYSPNYTVNVSGGGDVKDIERALVKASGQERNNFTAWNDSSRLAY